MKRQKNMLVLLLVLVLLIGAVFAVSALTKEEEPENNVQDLGEVIVAIDPNSVTSMRWNYRDEVSFNRVNGGWEYAADPDFPLDENRITAALNMLKSITAIKVIENVADWDQYGLEVPVCEVTINAGTSYSLSFGSEASVADSIFPLATATSTSLTKTIWSLSLWSFTICWYWKTSLLWIP